MVFEVLEGYDACLYFYKYM